MNTKFVTILLGAVLLFSASPAFATYCPSGQHWDYSKSECVKDKTPDPPKTCPVGQVGTPPNCTTPPVVTNPPNNTNTNNNSNANHNNNANNNANHNANNNANHNANTNTQGQNQGQAQGQAQGQGQNQSATATGGAGGSVAGSGNSANTNTLGQNTNVGIGDVGSNSAATGGSVGNVGSSSTSGSNSGGNTLSNGSNSGGNSMGTTVDTSDRSTTNVDARQNTLFIPTIQTAAPAIVAGSNIIVEKGQCGPLQSVETTAVDGTYVGIFKRAKIPLGQDDRLGVYVNENGITQSYRYVVDPQGVTHIMGHQPVTYAAVLGVAASRAVTLGGGKGTDWGQGGASSSSSMQRMVFRVHLADCEIGTVQPVRYHEVPAKKKKINR